MDSMLPRSWEIRQNLLPTMRKPQQKGPVTLIFTRALWETLAHTSEYYLVLWSAAMGSDCCNISAGKLVSSTGGIIWEQAGPDAVSGCHLFGVGPIPQMNSHENFLYSTFTITDITLTSQGASWRLKAPTTPLFIQPFFHAHIKQNIKFPRDWPLCGESTDDRWIPLTKGQSRGKCFHLMTSSWNGVILTKFSSLDALEIVIVNFPCSQWQEFCQNDYLSVSVSRSEKTDAVLQTTFSHTFLWMKIIVFWCEFHGRLFREAHLSSIDSGNGLAPNRRQVITW